MIGSGFAAAAIGEVLKGLLAWVALIAIMIFCFGLLAGVWLA